KPEQEFDYLDDFENEGEIETFSEEDIKKLGNIENAKIRILAKLVLGTGLRMGEVLGLDEKDIKDMTVYVTKQLKLSKEFENPTQYKYVLKITSLKTKRSKRKVPIPSALKNDLKELKKIK